MAGWARWNGETRAIQGRAIAGLTCSGRAVGLGKNSYSENTNRKLWAAKYAARHPNLVALEMSSFKCGHDAPIYSAIEEIIETSGTPYFCFKDIDENKPAGSIKIRVETIAYFLQRHRQKLVWERRERAEIERHLSTLELRASEPPQSHLTVH